MSKQKTKKVSHKHVHKELKGILETLNSDVIKALDIKEAKKQLEEKTRQLINEEIELKDVVAHLKDTKSKLQNELNTKEREVKGLQDKISHLKEDRAGLESTKLSLTEQIKNLNLEKEQMFKSLEKTNNLLVSLKHEITSFDDQINT